MFHPIRNGRSLRRAGNWLLLGLLLALLAGCGGSSSAVDPETRVKNFFNDLSSAFSDPAIADAATQEKWATTLAGYTKPSELEKNKADAKKSLGDYASQMGSLKTMTGGLDVHGVMKFENIQTKLATDSTDTLAKVEIVGGTVKPGIEGPDVAKLPAEVSAMLQGQELPIADIVKQMEFSDGNVITLENVDGTWYLVKKTN